jgi:carbonic anhydrase/acetyltransferase-like protein (isoleucine patch superfamily)
VAAGAVVRNRTEVPEGALAVGVPAQIKEGASAQEEIERGAALYVWNAKRYRTDLRLL